MFQGQTWNQTILALFSCAVVPFTSEILILKDMGEE